MLILSNNKLKVIVFGDSFSSALEKFMKESFGEILVIPTPEIDYNLIDKEKPNIVIHEPVERHLDILLNP